MAVTLHVDTTAWRAMVDRVWNEFPDLVPVVKGNGYGFGRTWLAQQAIARGALTVAVGTVHELVGVAALPVRVVVLTPSLDLDTVPVSERVVLTVASPAQLDHLLGCRASGAVSVKLASSMRRHGFRPDQLGDALGALAAAGIEVDSVSIHPGLSAPVGERRQEIEELLRGVPAGLPVSVSHLDAVNYRELREAQPSRRVTIRLGSALWHGDKASLRLTARVLDVREVHEGACAGYRATRVPGRGSVVVVDAGSSHGVGTLPDGRSPYHYGRRRLDLLEPPHMHVSMLFVPDGDPCPRPGLSVDVQRPLLMTDVDRISWE